jgi:hypothetical protein
MRLCCQLPHLTARQTLQNSLKVAMRLKLFVQNYLIVNLYQSDTTYKIMIPGDLDIKTQKAALTSKIESYSTYKVITGTFEFFSPRTLF